MAYKKLIKVSNECQLLDKRDYPATTTINGVTFTNNSDGTITVKGASTYTAYILLNSDNLSLKSGHKYLINDGGAGVSFTSYTTYLNTNNTAIAYTDRYSKHSIYTSKGNASSKCYIRVSSGIEVPAVVFKPQLFDLTEMYGAGHEPKTAEEFRQDFPEELYDYSPHCWLTSYKRVITTGEGNYLTSYQRNLTCKTKYL